MASGIFVLSVDFAGNVFSGHPNHSDLGIGVGIRVDPKNPKTPQKWCHFEDQKTPLNVIQGQTISIVGSKEACFVVFCSSQNRALQG